jgi:hypothetical protein
MKKIELAQTEILDQCIRLIQTGEATIADCLQAYPEHAAYLEPLFLTALEVQSGLSPKSPDKRYISTTRIRILNQLQALQKGSQEVDGKPPRIRIRLPRPVLALLSLALALIILSSSIGVASVSANVLPGDILYPVKRSIEELQLFFTIQPAKDAELLLAFTAERVQEIEDLLKLDPTQDLNSAIQEYDGMLSRLLETAQEDDIIEDPDVLDLINGGISHHEEVLQSVLEQAPASAQEGLENAIERSSHGKSVIQTIQEGGSPSDLAPGQQKKETEDLGKPENNGRDPKSEDKTKGPKPKDETPTPNGN